MDHYGSSLAFADRFERLRVNLECVDERASCCGWVSLCDATSGVLLRSIQSLVPPGLSTKMVMHDFLVPKILKTQRTILFWEDLEINNSREYSVRCQAQQYNYSRGIIASYVKKRKLYVGMLMISRGNLHSFLIFKKISFSFFDFFDVGIKHIELIEHA